MNANRLTATFLPGAAMALAVSIATLCWADTPASHAENQGANHADPVVASFDRDMRREAVPMAPAHRNAIAEDQLYRALNPVLWTDARRAVHQGDPCAVRNVEPSLDEKDGFAAETGCARSDISIQSKVISSATVQ